MCTNGENIRFCKFYSDFLLPFRSQTLVNCTSLDSLRCVVYFYSRLKEICATSKRGISAEKPGVAVFTLRDLWLYTVKGRCWNDVVERMP